MINVAVTEYRRPDGHQVEQACEVPDECREPYEDICGKGWNLAAEKLMSGAVSLTVEDRANGVDISIRVVPNGPRVQEALAEVIKEAALSAKTTA